MPVIAAFQGEHHDSFYGYSMVSLDFNADGFDDVAIAASHEYAPPALRQLQWLCLGLWR